MNNFTRRIMSFGLVLCASVCMANDKPAPLVAVSEVTQAQISEQVWIPGTVVSRYDARLTTEVSGVIKWVAEAGEQFKKGDVLLKIDDAFLQLAHQQAQANKKRLQTRVALYKRQQQRLTKLGDNAALDALDEKAAELDMAEQELVQAKVDLKRIELQITKTALTAPFDGTVVERYKQVGEFSQTSTNALRLVSMNNLEVKANAPLEHNQFNQVNDRVLIKQKSHRIESQIRALIPVGDEQSRTMEMRIKLNDQKLPIGSAVRVSIASSETHQALTVDRDALILRQDQIYVNVIDEALKNRQVNVELGSGFDQYIEVKGALQAGENVAIRGAENLKTGDTVRLMNDKTLTAKR